MSSGPKVVIGFPLHQATKSALAKFRSYLPSGVLDVPKEVDETEFVNEWAAPLIGVTLEAVLDAVGRWLRDPELVDAKGRTRIPQIASFAAYARKVDFEHWRPPLVLEPQRPSNEGSARQREMLQKRAEAALGSRELAQEVWGVLLRQAPPGAPSQAVRDGSVSMQAFDEAIEIVRESARLAKRIA